MKEVLGFIGGWLCWLVLFSPLFAAYCIGYFLIGPWIRGLI